MKWIETEAVFLQGEQHIHTKLQKFLRTIKKRRNYYNKVGVVAITFAVMKMNIPRPRYVKFCRILSKAHSNYYSCSLSFSLKWNTITAVHFSLYFFFVILFLLLFGAGFLCTLIATGNTEWLRLFSECVRLCVLSERLGRPTDQQEQLSNPLEMNRRQAFG